jgi:hypothetical protein
MPPGQSFTGYAGSDPFKKRSKNCQHPDGVLARPANNNREKVLQQGRKREKL